MQVLIVRHAIAEDYEKFALTGQADDLRPLTDKGESKMRKNIAGIKNFIPFIHRIATSPLRRAIQTADLLAKTYPSAYRDTLIALEPRGQVTLLLDYLQEYTETMRVIALVGHEPHLGELTTWLLSGRTNNWLPLKKGSACLLEFPYEIKPGQATLRWLLTPRQLRALAKP